MTFIFGYITTIFLFWVKLVMSISLSNKNMYFTDVADDIANYIAAKRYIPKENELPRASLIKNIDNDATYLLSKLSDEELLKLLNEQPQKKEFNLNDILRIAFNIRTNQNNMETHRGHKQEQDHIKTIHDDSFTENKRFNSLTNKNKPPVYFKLNHKVVNNNDDNYIALQKIKNLLNVHSKYKTEENFDENNSKKELMFDVLVAELKSLCCNRSKKAETNRAQYIPGVNQYLPSSLKYNDINQNQLNTPVQKKFHEYMFLVVNDDLKSNESDVLMRVDPESLDGNNSILLLGPVTSELSDKQLKLVMDRVSNELIKPDYLSLLQRLSDGIDKNINVLKNFTFGPETRRYIKPHRCNHQSKLAKVYGGPKWLICTGYLNINKPSLYD